MKQQKSNSLAFRLAESGLLLALATALSIWPKLDMPMGGGLTICSMLPLVILAYRQGLEWGLYSALAYGMLQCFLGMDNVLYGETAFQMILIALLDYIVAYFVLGFAGIFRDKFHHQGKELALGILITFAGRFFCHFLSGWLIWDALWPNEFEMLSPVYSLCYNAFYMVPELVITVVVAFLLTKCLDIVTLKPPKKAD